MTAIRSVRAAEGKFVQIANAALQDRRLSLSARGLIAFVLSLPPEKTFSAAWLETQVPDGRREIRSALRELAACGYYRRSKTSSGGTWIWDQVISDAPLPAESEDSTFPQVTPYDRNRPHDATSKNDVSAGDACDRNAPDATRPDKELKTEPPNTQVLANTASQKKAPRRARALRDAGETDTGTAIFGDIRRAVADVFGDHDAGHLTEEACARLYDRFCRQPDGTPREIGTTLYHYLTRGPFKDFPDLDAALRPKRPRTRVSPEDRQEYDDVWTDDASRVAIIEHLVGGFYAGEEGWVGEVVNRKKSLSYILSVLESGVLADAA